MTVKHILITDASTPANAGDSAIIGCLTSELRCHFADADIVVLASAGSADVLAEHHGVTAIDGPYTFTVLSNWPARLRWALRAIPTTLALFGMPIPRRFLPKAVRSALSNYDKADVVVSCGGGFLNSYYRLQLPFSLVGLWYAARRGKKAIVFAQSLGPFEQRWVRRLTRTVLRSMSGIFVRDPTSMFNLASLPVDGPIISCTADVALLQRADVGNARRWLEAADVRSSGRRLVGISVLRWCYPGGDAAKQYERYVEVMTRAADFVVDRLGASVLFVSTNSSLGSNRTDDRAVAEEVRAGMDRPDAAYFFDHDGPSPAMVKGVLGEIDLFIGTRMHACIFATSQAIPTVNICYEFKSRDYMTSLEMGEYVVEIDDIDATALESVVERAWKDRAALAHQLRERIPGRQDAARTTADLVHTIVDPAGSSTCGRCMERATSATGHI